MKRNIVKSQALPFVPRTIFYLLFLALYGTPTALAPFGQLNWWASLLPLFHYRIDLDETQILIGVFNLLYSNISEFLVI